MCIRDRGMFVGAVADNFDERIEQKIFQDVYKRQRLYCGKSQSITASGHPKR